jgi:V/A-type H+/Na+-transporting ATPase subunit A
MNNSMDLLADYHPASVVAVQDDLVTIQMAESQPRPLLKNEVIYICLQRRGEERQEKLKAEVLRVRGRLADAQVFESTKGVGIGDPVDQTGEQLSVTLGPGLLGQVYDGLQNPLAQIAAGYGTFLPRGAEVSPLDREKKWSFQPRAKIGDTLLAGDVIGTVQEGRFSHKIMVPFDQQGAVTLDWIQQGSFTIDTAVARIREGSGAQRPLTLTQQWPVRRALPQALLEMNRCERLYPQEPLITSQRIIDTFLPDRPRRHRLHPRPLRRRQDRAAEPDRASLRCRHRDGGGLRRARRRGGGNDHRIPGNADPRPAAR